VSEKHLRIGDGLWEEKASQRPLGEKHLPGVHQAKCLQRMRRATPPVDRDDVELAVGAHQLSIPVLDENKTQRPSARENLREVITHSIVGCAVRLDSLYHPFQHWKGTVYRSYWICTSFGSFGLEHAASCPCGSGVLGLRTGEYDVLLIGLRLHAVCT